MEYGRQHLHNGGDEGQKPNELQRDQMGYFASKFVCYIDKGREMKDPLEQRKDIFPMTMDIVEQQ